MQKITTALLAAMSACMAIGAANPARAAGAKTPWVMLEAEAGQRSGNAMVHAFIPGSPVPATATLELEASGSAYVRLKNTGDAIAWPNPVQGANAIVVRSSLPDAPAGGGITGKLNLYVDGKLRQAITLSSKQSWVYRTPNKGWLDTPADGGMPFKFYNEDSFLITGPPIAKNATIMLRRDAEDTAPEYNIDCVDIEHVDPPLKQPAGSLSVLDFGAKPNTDQDCQLAIQKCIDQAKQTNKSVFIPPGRYKIASVVPKGIDLKDVTVHGAGMWYTILYRERPTAPVDKSWRSYLRVGEHATVTDLQIDCNSVRRATGQAYGGDYGVLAGGDGWLVQRLWVRHCDANWMSGTNGVIRDCRVADSWGDGINLNNGNKPGPDNTGMHLTAENNFVRGTGDDGLATYSDAGDAGNNSQMVGTHILNNTSVAPYWANALRVAGGKDVVVRGNLLLGSASNSGMTVATFGKTGQPLESALIEDNEIHQGGGWNGTDRHGLSIGSPADKYSNVIVRNNLIIDSFRDGIHIDPTLVNVTLENNRVIHPAMTGIQVSPGVTGTAILKSNTITVSPSQPATRNDSTATFKISD